MKAEIENVELKFSNKDFKNQDDCAGSLSINIVGDPAENIDYSISLNFDKISGEGISAILNIEQLKKLKSILVGYENYILDSSKKETQPY
ncbi:hypothetical protein [Tenacibaculum maritimum]|uniref:hypothetical protein n=1 Tax=Tenacibaculum maritimum TaxID=107401 RepID=UPI0038763A95